MDRKQNYSEVEMLNQPNIKWLAETKILVRHVWCIILTVTFSAKSNVQTPILVSAVDINMRK